MNIHILITLLEYGDWPLAKKPEIMCDNLVLLTVEMTSKTISDLRIKLLKKGLFDCRHHSIQMGLKELKLFSQEYPKGNK